MLKLVSLLLFLAGSAHVSGIACPVAHLSPADLPGNFPIFASNITTIPKGTNCTLQFDIPNNYALQLMFSADFQSKDDTVTIFDNQNEPWTVLTHTGYIIYSVPLWMPANFAAVQIVGVSGNSRVLVSYKFQQLNGYQQVKMNTGEHFPLSKITPNTYYTITSSSALEKVALNYAQRIGVKDPDPYLSEYYVYDGDNIINAKMIGNIANVASNKNFSSGSSYSIVNFYGSTTKAYALGNDASTIQGLSKYNVYLTTLGTSLSGKMTDLSGNEAGYTFICTDCSTFYWTKMVFDSMATIANKGYVSFQGQTPTHKREKLIRYDAMTFTNNQLPQLMPSNVITFNLYLSRITFDVNNVNDDTLWKKPYSGRTGFIFSPTLWTYSATNNFNYEFRDDSQLFNYTMIFNKMSLPATQNALTLKIGSPANLAVDKQFPRDASIGKVTATGNYMQVGLTGTTGADVRLSFEIGQKGAIATTTTPRRTTTTPIKTTTSGASYVFSGMLTIVAVLRAII